MRKWIFVLQFFVVWCKKEDTIMRRMAKAPRSKIVPVNDNPPSHDDWFVEKLSGLIFAMGRPSAVVVVVYSRSTPLNTARARLKKYSERNGIPFVVVDRNLAANLAHKTKHCPGYK